MIQYFEYAYALKVWLVSDQKGSKQKTTWLLACFKTVHITKPTCCQGNSRCKIYWRHIVHNSTHTLSLQGLCNTLEGKHGQVEVEEEMVSWMQNCTGMCVCTRHMYVPVYMQAPIHQHSTYNTSIQTVLKVTNALAHAHTHTHTHAYAHTHARTHACTHAHTWSCVHCQWASISNLL